MISIVAIKCEPYLPHVMYRWGKKDFKHREYHVLFTGSGILHYQKPYHIRISFYVNVVSLILKSLDKFLTLFEQVSALAMNAPIINKTH